MSHNPKTLQAIMEKAAPPDMDLTFRPMFGGILAYADAKPLASLSDVGLALKLSGDDHAALMGITGAKALQYDASQPVSKSYVVVPEDWLQSKEPLRGWILRAAAGLKTVAKKAPKKSR